MRSLISAATSVGIAVAFAVFTRDFSTGIVSWGRWAFYATVVVILGWTLAPLRRFWLRRPSDVIFGPDRFRIEGGQQGGFQLAYADLLPNRCTVKEDYRKNSAGLHTTTLLVNDHKLATADEADEAASLEEVLAAILSRKVAKPSKPSKRGRGAAPREVEEAKDDLVLACKGCGAPVPPSKDDVVRCAHCGAEVPIPQELRDRVTAAEGLPDNEARVAQALTKLLDQPPASAVTKRIVASFVLGTLACPFSFLVYEHARHRHELSWTLGLGLVSLPFLLVFVSAFLSWLPVIERHALRDLLVSFGARARAKEGDAPQCRCCSAPLPITAGIVVSCAYCRATNILGIDLRSRAQAVERSKSSLEPALAALEDDRRQWTWLVAIGSTGSVALVAFVLVLSFR